ncbi:hypothetical protein B0O41_3964 [Propionibacteriaceae bacterium ES.041]|nr:hypothetical protein B0O41_3964 [Propionibacteriaceae bacterium ES.041]
MLPLPTSLAVAAAAHHRELSELTIDELAFVTLMHGNEIPAERIGAIEGGEQPATVDELMVLAVVLDVTPSDLLAYVPEDAPLPEHPLATGVLGDVDAQELRAWLENRTALDHESRLRWAEDRVQRLEIRSSHLEDQLRAALEELSELGDLALQEADALPVTRLHDRIQDGEHALSQATTGLAYAEHRLERLQED